MNRKFKFFCNVFTALQKKKLHHFYLISCDCDFISCDCYIIHTLFILIVILVTLYFKVSLLHVTCTYYYYTNKLCILHASKQNLNPTLPI